MAREPEYVNTHQTPEAQEAHDLLRQNVATLTQQRDELATCLNNVLNMLKAAHMQIGMRSEENPRVIRARAALAKVKS